MTRVVAAAICGILVSAAAAPAWAQAPSAESCAAAYEEAQRRQKKGALLESREQATTCANAACPAEIVKFCSDIARGLDETIPTIVVAVTDGRGGAVAGARLVVDGKEPGALLDGRPVPLDPGLHRLRIVPASTDLAPADLEVTVLAGERNKRVDAKVAPRRLEPRAEGPPPVVPLAPADAGGSYAPAGVAFAFGGIGLVLGAVTGAMALSDESALQGKCGTPTSCPTSEQGRIDREKSLATVSTIGFVAGAVGVAAGVVLLAVRAKPSKRAPLAASPAGLRLRF